MKFRKKTVVIEAFKWTGDVHQEEDPIWAIEALKKPRGLEGSAWFINECTPDVCLVIKTLEGKRTARRGDYIIRGIKGEIYPCKQYIFEATYEPVK